jgi:hypothetical protein
MKKSIYSQENILESNQFVNPVTGFQFPHPKMFFDRLNNELKGEITINGSHETVQAINDIEQIAFGRVSFVKDFEISEDINYSIGFIYSYDYAKPFIKVFSGVNVKACTNLCVFNALHIEKFDFYTQGYEAAINKAIYYFNNVEKDILQSCKIIEAMKKTIFSPSEVDEFFGRILRNFSSIKNIAGVTSITNGMELLTNKKSRYFVAPNKNTNCWNIYNALTDGYRDKTHIIDQPEKVLSLFNEMLNISKYLENPIEDNIKIDLFIDTPKFLIS